MSDAPAPDPVAETDRPRPRGPVRRSKAAELDRRVVVASAVVLIGALLLGVAIVAVTYDPDTAATTTTTMVGEAGGASASPGIIPDPNSGSAPTDAGDRGGAGQLALMGLILAALVGIGVIVAKGGGAKARANRAAWRAAADNPDGFVPRD